jgi:hypothetical protein
MPTLQDTAFALRLDDQFSNSYAKAEETFNAGNQRIEQEFAATSAAARANGKEINTLTDFYREHRGEQRMVSFYMRDTREAMMGAMIGMQALQGAMGQGTGSAKVLNQALVQGTGAFLGFNFALAALGVTGPVGIAIAGVGALGVAFLSTQAAAEKAAQELLTAKERAAELNEKLGIGTHAETKSAMEKTLDALIKKANEFYLVPEPTWWSKTLEAGATFLGGAIHFPGLGEAMHAELTPSAGSAEGVAATNAEKEQQLKIDELDAATQKELARISDSTAKQRIQDSATMYAILESDELKIVRNEEDAQKQILDIDEKAALKGVTDKDLKVAIHKEYTEKRYALDLQYFNKTTKLEDDIAERLKAWNKNMAMPDAIVTWSKPDNDLLTKANNQRKYRSDTNPAEDEKKQNKEYAEMAKVAPQVAKYLREAEADQKLLKDDAGGYVEALKKAEMVITTMEGGLTSMWQGVNEGFIKIWDDTLGQANSLFEKFLQGVMDAALKALEDLATKAIIMGVLDLFTGGAASAGAAVISDFSNDYSGGSLEHASGADFDVPPGYNNDSFPLGFASSGEHVTITPANKAGDAPAVPSWTKGAEKVGGNFSTSSPNYVAQEMSANTPTRSSSAGVRKTEQSANSASADQAGGKPNGKTGPAVYNIHIHTMDANSFKTFLQKTDNRKAVVDSIRSAVSVGKL